jgi:gallate dioxygenase
LRVVGGVGVPHTPHFPLLAQRDDELGHQLTRLYGSVAAELASMRPDLVILLSSDHYNTFFVSSLPIFSIVTAPQASGPVDYRELQQRTIPMHAEVARRLQNGLVAADFDIGQTQEFGLDHPMTIPLHFLLPDSPIPVIPLFVSGLMPPLPSVRRCYRLGQTIREILESFEDDARVAVIASGSFSLEIGGPHISDHSHVGVPDPDWVARVMELLATSDIEQLMTEADGGQLTEAGNAGGELLDWITMFGAISPVGPAAFLEAQVEWGHGYGAWHAG